MAIGAWRHRELILLLARRDIAGRYRGSLLGLAWSLLIPIATLMVYTFVFRTVFNARWPNVGDTGIEFALALFAGLLTFNLFAECINRAPGLVLANANYVKKVVFPLETLPLISLASALFQFCAGVCVWVLYHFFLFGMVKPALLLLPAILLPLALLTLGASWFLASLGVFLRDIGQITGTVTTALMFLSPVFYPISAVPERFRFWMHLNPLSQPIDQVRDLMLTGQLPDPALFGLQFMGSLFVAWAGYCWFQKTRKGFGDVI